MHPNASLAQITCNFARLWSMSQSVQSQVIMDTPDAFWEQGPEPDLESGSAARDTSLHALGSMR